MDTISISKDTCDELVAVLREDSAVSKRFLKAADMLRAEGVTSDMLRSDADFRAAFRANVIMLSFSKTDQAIAAKAPTLLTDAERVSRRYIHTECGSRIAKVIKYVERSEKNEMITDEERGAQASATLSTRLHRDLVAWIGRIEKAERVDFPAAPMVSKLKEALSLIK